MGDDDGRRRFVVREETPAQSARLRRGRLAIDWVGWKPLRPVPLSAGKVMMRRRSWVRARRAGAMARRASKRGECSDHPLFLEASVAVETLLLLFSPVMGKSGEAAPPRQSSIVGVIASDGRSVSRRA